MSLSEALFSPAQAAVLPWLFGQPERWYHVNELLRLSGLGSASLQRELARLDSAGLVSAERIGNLRRFRANPASPVHAELVALVRKTLSVVPVIKQALEPLADQILLGFIYGSVARRQDHARSDIDLMVISESLTAGDILRCTVDAEESLGRKISPTCYVPEDFMRRQAQPDSFVSRVLSQPVMPIWGELPASTEVFA